LLRGVARLEVVTIAPARHFAMLDQPEAFTTALRKFLDAP
jgi:pimeloyl-ACP methyl ester carboxylesterase